MDRIRAVVAQYPRIALVLGKALLLIGSILVVGAVFARAGLVSINAERAGAKLPLLHTLAQAYPQHPTWLVPEGPIGFGIAAVLVLVGMALALLAERGGQPRRR